MSLPRDKLTKGQPEITMHRRVFATALALALAAPLTSHANDANEAAVNARQSLMTLIAYNLGPMALMAQGRMDYDADIAQRSADNLYNVTRHAQDRLWPEGTAYGEMDDTAARPAIWEDLEEFSHRYSVLQDAAEGVRGAAGDGLSALQGALGDLGGACRACHDQFRVAD